MDPSIRRGLTQPRLSRRDMLKYAAAGAGAFGLAGLASACGVQGATATATKPGGVGSADWWSKQKLHH
jgi:anaerobic selenocysteine-containing dehydrogenase